MELNQKLMRKTFTSRQKKKKRIVAQEKYYVEIAD